MLRWQERLAALWACALLGGCSAEVERTTASFVLAEVESCPLEGLRSIETLELTVAGDFPSRSTGAQRTGAALQLDALPLDARALSLQARLTAGRAAGLAALPPDMVGAPLLLLPLDASCPLGDPLAAAPIGAAVAPTPGGALLIAGGRLSDGSSLASAAVLPRSGVFAVQVEGGLLLRRAFASATALSDGVLVAGGGPDDEGPAHDTFEIFDEGSARFLPPQRLADGPRRNHGAARLPDGRVLLVGGLHALGGEPLGSAELLAPEDGSAQALRGVLREARVEPSVLVLDEGRVLVLLGRESDDVAAAVVRGVEQLELTGQRFERVASLPAHASAAVAPLAGGRVAYLGCEDEGACELSLLLPAQDGGLALVTDVIASDVLTAAGVRGLSTLRLAALRDGTLLVTGRASGTALGARAFVLDLSAGTILQPPPEASRVPDQLVELADGTLVELDAFGASLRRHDARSAFHDPSDALLTPDALSVDAPERVQFDDDGAHALAAARLELPFLRFGRLHVELALQGEGLLLLKPEHAPAVAIALGSERIAVGDCSLARADDAPLVLERRGGELTLRSGDARRICTAQGLSGLLGLALQLEAGAVVTALRVERR